MPYQSIFHRSKWFGQDGENANAECNQLDECDWSRYGVTLRQATRAAEDHALTTGHPVLVERTLSRIIEVRKP